MRSRGTSHDGASVALEGFTHLIPFAAGHEIIRQQRRDLHLIRMTPDLIYDQMIGMGCARKLTFSWGGNPGVGSLHRLRDAVENDWPQRARTSTSTATRHGRGLPGRRGGLPFGMLRGYVDTDLTSANAAISARRPARSPASAAGGARASIPTSRSCTRSAADRAGNVADPRHRRRAREAALAAPQLIVTVEEIVDAPCRRR